RPGSWWEGDTPPMKHLAFSFAISFALCASRADAQTFTTLIQFTGTGGTAAGLNPYGDLILSGTTLYGVTEQGGTAGYGNVFSVGINGSGYDDLYDFTGGADGAYPYGDLTLIGGTLFGMTNAGGNGVALAGDGTIFALTLPTPEPGTLALVGIG